MTNYLCCTVSLHKTNHDARAKKDSPVVYSLVGLIHETITVSDFPPITVNSQGHSFLSLYTHIHFYQPLLILSDTRLMKKVSWLKDHFVFLLSDLRGYVEQNKVAFY